MLQECWVSAVGIPIVYDAIPECPNRARFESSLQTTATVELKSRFVSDWVFSGAEHFGDPSNSLTNLNITTVVGLGCSFQTFPVEGFRHEP